MTQPILVVDFGSYATTAAVVVGEQIRPVNCPMTGAPRWPSAVWLDSDNLLVGTAAVQRRDALPQFYADCLRRALDSGVNLHLGERSATGAELLSAYLRAVCAEAQRQHGLRIQRLALTVPTDYGQYDQRREALVAVATEAGFPDVELVSAAVAATMDPQTHPDLPDDALMLVCDLGAAWSVTLTRVAREQPKPLAQETSGGGQDFDELLVNDLRATLHDWISPALNAGGDTGLRARYAAADFVRRVKHRLCDADSDEVTDWISPSAPPYRLTRAGLDRLADPALRWLLASCRAVVARSGFSLADVTGVILVGGASTLPVAKAVLQAELGRPVWHPSEPALAPIRGAARWAAQVASRRVVASSAPWRMEPLSWDLPDGRARLVRWLVEQGQPYSAGALLAQVRTVDDRVWDLTAQREGILVEQRVLPGEYLGSDSIAGLSRSAKVISGDRAAKRHQMRVAGDWLLTPDHRFLVECERSGTYVRTRSIATGAVVNEVRPTFGGSPAHNGRVFLAPNGRFALISWDAEGQFQVWDVPSGRLISRFGGSAKPVAVLVHETQWRLVAEADRKVNVGRYRRDVATMWDLGTGAVVEEMVGDDLQRRYTGYVDRSAADGFAAEVRSPDGRLRAGSAQSKAGAAVWLHESDTDTEVFRADLDSAHSVRTAFSADGHHLLARWSAPEETSCVDVWQV